jgi:nitrous oxidase accessory protein NosD
VPLPPPLTNGESGARPVARATPVLVVAQTGAADHRSIGDALRSAAPGTRILVRPGTYLEALVLDKAVELVGDGPLGQVVVETAVADCILMTADEATVRGLTLRGKAGTRGAKYFAVDVTHGRLLLENCDVSNDSLACVGVHGPSANPTVRIQHQRVGERQRGRRPALAELQGPRRQAGRGVHPSAAT